MITAITIFVLLLSLLFLLPTSELFPTRYLQRSLHTIQSRASVPSHTLAYTTSTLAPKIITSLSYIARWLRIDGYAPRWYRYKAQISRANLERFLTIEQFAAAKYALSIAVLLYFLALTFANPSIEMLLLTAIITMMAYFLPDQWLKIRVKQRIMKIQKELPSILISLAVTTDAGLSLIQSLEEVCRRKSGELSIEFRKTLQEIAVGIPQREAFENMADRLLIDELTHFISAILQTLQKGAAGITQVLRNQADEAWAKRKSLAKETGEKASIKLFLPLMGFILPALMIFLIAPAIFTIMQFFIFD